MFEHRALLPSWLCALLACSSPPAPAPTSNATTEPAGHANVCITRSKEEYAPSADSITIGGRDVSLCFGVEPQRSCWRADIASQRFAPQPVTAPDPDAPRLVEPPRAKARMRDARTIELCAPGGSPCKTFANPGPTGDPEWLGVSDDLATLAIPDGATLRIYDVAKAKRRATIKGWADSPMLGNHFLAEPTFATPDRMIVWYSWTPVSDQGRIFDMSGHQLAIVGHEFWSIGPDQRSWHVHGAEWAIKGEDNTLLTVDASNPAVTSTYDLSPLRAQPRPPKDSDTGILDVLGVAGTADRLIIVTGENPVTIGVLDRATRRLVKLEPPRCPPR